MSGEDHWIKLANGFNEVTGGHYQYVLPMLQFIKLGE